MKRTALPAVAAVIAAVFFVSLIQIGIQIYLARQKTADFERQLVIRKAELRSQEEEAVVRERTAELRELEFKKPVPSRIMGRDEIKQFVLDQIEELYSKEEIQGYEQSLKLFSVVPDEMDIKKVISDIYASEAGGFYDQHSGVLYRVSQVAMKSAIFAHEYTHALQDQHFDLSELPLEQKENDDLSLATLCLVEGDATVMTSEYIFAYPDMELVLGTVSSLTGGAGAGLRNAPPYLREMIQFPYLKGTEFVVLVKGRGSWGAVNRMYADPPVSTEQILHPDKYTGILDLPKRVDVAVTLGVIERFCEGDWSQIYRNVMGEYATLLFLRTRLASEDAEKASEGWGGDRYIVCRSGENSLLSWSTIWDSVEDAEEFYQQMERFASKETGSKTPGLRDGDTVLWEGDNMCTVLKRDQTVVHVIRTRDRKTAKGLFPGLAEGGNG
jgi:hypothetical protein